MNASTPIADLAEDRVVEQVFAVARKERLRTRSGSPYLALELVDPSGRIEARVWTDVELLDRRFETGDAVRVLGRVERYRDRLQLDVRDLDRVDVDPATLVPEARRDLDELDGFLEFLAAELTHAGLRAIVARFLTDPGIRTRLRQLPAAPGGHHDYAGGLLEHTVNVATLCRETASVHPRLRSDLLIAAAILHDVGRIAELDRGPIFTPTEEGRLLGHVHLGLRLIEERSAELETSVRAEVVHAVAVHHDARAARTAEAAALYHANQLDAVAATRPVPETRA
ncbi:MAG: HD domain-containing protein [Gaiellales bacterium]